MLTALQLTAFLVTQDKPLSKLRFKEYPQVSTKLQVSDKKRLINHSELQSYLSSIQQEDPQARIVLRASGTEPVIRVMV